VTAPSAPTYLVTGANAGIGRAVTRQLAAAGGRVLMACRSRERGEEARSGIRESVDGARLEVLQADLSSQRQVRELAAAVRERTGRLDALVNNAGVYLPERRTSPDGLELQLAVNYVAPFLLTRELGPLLRESAPSRVVTVASMEHRLGRIHFDDLQLEDGYSGGRAYRQSKLATVLWTRELARRWEGRGVTANAVHPGVAFTRLVYRISALSRLVKWLLKSPEEAAEGPVYLATSPEVADVTGAYFRGTRRVRPAGRARDPEKARRLWRETERLVGEP
jgi:NAD(P)-dependent dehydrogenase (short-subunit alcohol dehydrogenase family)